MEPLRLRMSIKISSCCYILLIGAGVHGQGAEGEDIHPGPLPVRQPGPGVHDVGRQLPVQLAHQIQLQDKVRAAAQDVGDIVLLTAGDVQVSEGPAVELLHGPVVAGPLRPDDQMVHGSFLLRKTEKAGGRSHRL